MQREKSRSRPGMGGMHHEDKGERSHGGRGGEGTRGTHKRKQALALAPFLSDRRAAMRTVVPPRRMRDPPHPCPVLVLLPPSSLPPRPPPPALFLLASPSHPPPAGGSVGAVALRRSSAAVICRLVSRTLRCCGGITPSGLPGQGLSSYRSWGLCLPPPSPSSVSSPAL